MQVGLVGYPGSGVTTVFGALTGRGTAALTGGRGKALLGAVKVPDHRVDALAALYQPKKTTYAEITFRDVPSGRGGIDRTVLNSMRPLDSLCQVVRAFPAPGGEDADPCAEIRGLRTETILADLEILEARVGRLRRDRSNPTELSLFERLQGQLEEERALRDLELGTEERRVLAGYGFLSMKPLLVVLNVPEEATGREPPAAVAAMARDCGLGLVPLSAPVEAEIASIEADEQPEFLASLGLAEPAGHRFIRAAYELCDLISMLTAGRDECRAWPVTRGTAAQRAAGKIHSDLERGFIRVEVTHWEDLVRLGSEAKCREAGALRVEGKRYVVRDGDVVHFRFNV